MMAGIGVFVLSVVLSLGPADGPSPQGAPAAKPPDVAQVQAIGTGLLDQFLDGLRSMAASGAQDIDRRLGEMMSAASKALEANQLPRPFFARYNRMLAVTRLVTMPETTGILTPVIDQLLWDFIKEKNGDLTGQELRGAWVKGGPEGVNLVAGALADEVVDLQLYLDTLPRREALRKKVDARMMGSGKGPASPAESRPGPSGAPEAAPDGLRLHEELLLVALRDRQGTVASASTARYAFGAALLAELLLAGRIEVREQGKAKYARLLDATPPGEPLLDEALALVAGAREPAKLRTWIERFAALKDFRARAAAGLVDRGVLRVERDKVAGLFNRTVYPQVDPRPERQLAARLEAAVFGDAALVEPRTALLVSLARNADLLPLVLDKGRLKDRTARLDRIQNGDLIGPAERQAVHAMKAAQAFTVIAASSAVVSSGRR